MNIKALVIAPYQGLLETIKDIEDKLPQFRVIVHLADLVESLKLLEQYKDKSIDFIISRGGTADLLREHTTIPVIDIEVSGYDILRILTLLKGYQHPIEMIAFKNIIQGFESVSKLIDMNLTYSVITHKEEVELAIQRAKEKGVKIIIGDTITVRIATEMGLQGVMITSGKESILAAFEKAKNMYHALESLREEALFYQNILDEIDTPLALVEEDGEVRFANDLFLKTLAIKQSAPISLFKSHPYLGKVLKLIKNGLQLHFQITVQENEECFDIKAVHFAKKGKKPFYYIELKKNEKTIQENDTITVRCLQNMEHYPPFLLTSGHFHRAVGVGIDRLRNGKPLTVTGETGAGKKMFAQALFKAMFSENGAFLEVKLGKVSMKQFNHFLKILDQESGEMTLIYIEGLENTSQLQQQKLMQVYEDSKVPLLFSFIGGKKILAKKESSLDPVLFSELNEEPLHFHSLKERTTEFEEIVQTFIIHFNERYGKQIVGVRANVLEKMKNHSWDGNLIELKKIIGELVRSSTDEYISEEGLMLFENRQTNEGPSINFNQSLLEMEAEIIEIVMHQENMNQSKAAKRLGIDRSTLWRKLNNK